MKIIKLDHSFSWYAIKGHAFSRLCSTQRNTDPYCVPWRVTFHFSTLQRARRKFHLFYYKNPGAAAIAETNPMLDIRLRYRGTTVLVRRKFSTSASLAIREKGDLVYTYSYSCVFSVAFFFVPGNKWYSYVLRKPRSRAIKSLWIWFGASVDRLEK